MRKPCFKWLEAALEGAEARHTRSKIENHIEALKRRFGGATSGEGKDNVLTFEEMAGIFDAKHVDIENMEGAAFFHVCREEQVPFLQLRAISNVVKPGHDDWNMTGSVQALTAGLHRLIDHLQIDSSGN